MDVICVQTAQEAMGTSCFIGNSAWISEEYSLQQEGPDFGRGRSELVDSLEGNTQALASQGPG